MPSEATPAETPQAPYSARCYCGGTRLLFRAPPTTSSYCHCVDCRRWTGAPLAAFAAFYDDAIATPLPAQKATCVNPGVWRWNCTDCGSPLAARFDYLPGQTYIPLGILDQAQATELAPRLHSHADSALPWLHVADDLPRAGSSARDRLNAATDDRD
ncbi:GFA family protein [Tritonibacter mobilis]